MYQSPPEAIFSAVDMVWTCFLRERVLFIGTQFNHIPISSRLDPSRRRKSVLHACTCSWPPHSPLILKAFLAHSCPFLKFLLLDASVPSFDDLIQRCLLQIHTRFVQYFAAVALASCNLAHPACFRKALRTLFIHTERTIVFPFCTSNVMRSVRSSNNNSCRHQKSPVPPPLECRLAP
jgi:hypothetical protein